MSHADSIDSVGIVGRSQRGGTVEMREVMQRQMFSKRLSSSTTPDMSRASVPCGSRMDSALSRTMNISREDRKGRRGVKSWGFSTLAPTTFESRLRKLASAGWNLSQRMNRRFSLNRFLIRSSWRTAKETDVLPIPPAPMRAIGVRLSARPMIFSINSSRPIQAPGGGGDSPSILGSNVRSRFYDHS